MSNALLAMMDIIDTCHDDESSEEEIIVPAVPEKRVPTQYAVENIMELATRQAIRDTILFDPEDLVIFTKPISTTITLAGAFTDVSFHEETHTHLIALNPRVFRAKSNYGDYWYPSYERPVIVEKCNRGRKKAAKPKKARKIQGSGTEFNSQITMFVDRNDGGKPFKFKVFRTGTMQLPGASQTNLDEVADCAKVLANALADTFNNIAESSSASSSCSGDSGYSSDPEQGNHHTVPHTVEVNYIKSVMKNYKFCIVKQQTEIIYLRALRDMMLLVMTGRVAGIPSHPDIFNIKFSRQDTKFSIKFNTPLLNVAKKRTRVNIFMSGKVNILGSHNLDMTRKICELLSWMLTKWHDTIIVDTRLRPRIRVPVQCKLELTDFEWDELVSVYGA